MCFLLSQCTILPIRFDVAYILRSRMIFRPSSIRFLLSRSRFMHFLDLSFCFFKSSSIQVIWNSNNVNEILVGYPNYERFGVCGFFWNWNYWIRDNFSRALWIPIVYYFIDHTLYQNMLHLRIINTVHVRILRSRIKCLEGKPDQSVLIAWIQSINLRKREFDRLEKIW